MFLNCFGKQLLLLYNSGPDITSWVDLAAERNPCALLLLNDDELEDEEGVDFFCQDTALKSPSHDCLTLRTMRGDSIVLD